MDASGPAELAEILQKFPNRTRDQLIPILQEIQAGNGWLSEEIMRELGDVLGMEPSKIYSVASFYDVFRFSPAGRRRILVCRGTSCHLHDSNALLEHISSVLGIRPGETTPDGAFSLEAASCLGACGRAPAVCINGTVHSSVTPDSFDRLLGEILQKEKKTE